MFAPENPGFAEARTEFCCGGVFSGIAVPAWLETAPNVTLHTWLISAAPSFCEQCRPRFLFNQEFDANVAHEVFQPARAVAATTAVNIHPHAKTFEGLVPVSVDQPPPRPKRKGKQVSDYTAFHHTLARCAGVLAFD